MKGTLRIRAYGALLVTDKDVIGKMDPYAILEVGTQKFKTISAQGMGLNPVWNEEFVFNIGADEELKITVYDSDLSKDDFLGQYKVKVDQLIQTGVIDNYFPLTSRVLKSNQGNIHLRIEFVPFGQQSYGNAPQQSTQKTYPTYQKEGSTQQGKPY